MGWWADGLMGQCIAWYIRKCKNWKDWTMQWGNGKMGNWGYVYKKDMEAILNLKQEQVQASKPWAICHKHTQMVEMIMTNESQTIKKKEFKKFGKMPTVHRCSPSVVVRLGGGAALRRHTAARRVQRSVWVCVCHRRLHVRSPELALASSSVLPPRLFRRHGRTCAYSTTQLYTSEPLLLTASVFQTYNNIKVNDKNLGIRHLTIHQI